VYLNVASISIMAASTTKFRTMLSWLFVTVFLLQYATHLVGAEGFNSAGEHYRFLADVPEETFLQSHVIEQETGELNDLNIIMF